MQERVRQCAAQTRRVQVEDRERRQVADLRGHRAADRGRIEVQGRERRQLAELRRDRAADFSVGKSQGH